VIVSIRARAPEDSPGRFMVVVELSDPPQQVRPGMTADALIQMSSARIP